MYKIMIADDEGIVIDGLTFLLEKEFGSKITIESAKSGRSVIELAEHYRPDIALMDIQMPGINGIEAMKEIRKFCPDMVFIVISAYDRFDYAKEALELGVMDYLNKPINKSVLVDKMSQAFQKVDKAREKRSNDLLIKEKLETVVPVIESGFIYSILFQENYAQDINSYKQLLGMNCDSGYVLAVKFGDDGNDGTLTNVVGVSVRIQSQYQVIRNCIKEFFNAYVGTLMGNMVVAYIPHNESKNDAEYEERTEEIEQARKMVRSLRKYTDAKARVGIGSVRPLHEAAISYAEAIDAFAIATGSVAHVKDLPIGCGYDEEYPVDIEKALYLAIEKGNVDEAIGHANQFLDWTQENYNLSEYELDVKMKLIEFVILAEKYAYEKGGMVYSFLSRQGYLSSLLEIKTISELRNWFILKIRYVCQNINQKREESSVTIVEKAKNYISQNYAKDISLDDVSREVNISPYYFSKLFKEEAGLNFIEYLTMLRMEQAKHLLRDTDLSIKEICAETGYSDPNYFSRTFKKNVGVTPSEYKEG